jgi:predicted flavoprotein YhiN
MYDAIVIGAGAAGLMAAISAGQNGKRVLIIEHTNKVGEKIRILLTQLYLNIQSVILLA